MASTFAVSRAQLIYGLCLPLAVLIGYFLAEPMDSGSMAVVVLVIALLCVPILMRWHYLLLIFAWNAAITLEVVPGRPYLWMLLAVVSLVFGVLNRSTDPHLRFVSIPAINRSLLFLLAAVIIIGLLRGGFGMRSFGSERYGGKGYFYIIGAVAGYFALVGQRIPSHRAGLYVGIFFLSGLTALVPNLAYLAGRKMEFLFYFFPTEYAMEQAMGDYAVNPQIFRVFGLTAASICLFCWLLMRYGLRGLFDWTRPWRLALLLSALAGCLFAGFRGVLIIFVAVVVLQAYFEGLFRPRFLLTAGAMLLLTGVLLFAYAQKLPLVVQRTISFLPLEINPMVKQSTEGSIQWRLEMWRDLLPQVPKYLLKGKGYAIDPGELNLAFQNTARGYGGGYADSVTAGDYHNGPLSLVIPFGIWGVIGFGWFLVGALKYLYGNYRRGDPALHRINTFLLVYFVARLVFFLVFFGGFYADLALFTGLVGLSASLNGTAAYALVGVSEQPAEVVYAEDFAQERM